MFARNHKKWLFLALLFSALFIGTCWSWHFVQVEQEYRIESLKRISQTFFEEHLRFRRWVSERGGIYIKKTPENPTNPFLTQLLGRSPDVETKDGVVLTLRNPATVLREIFQLEGSQNGMEYRLVSEHPVNPQNLWRDAFEKDGLAQFVENGNKPIFAMQERSGKQFFRYLAPFVVEKNCLGCHGNSGYKVGDIRGGISISGPVSSVFAHSNVVTPHSYSFLGAAVLLLVVFLGIYAFVIMGQRTLYAAREHAEKASQAKSFFVFGLSHDLRTPLTGILGGVDLMRLSGSLNAAQEECLNVMEASAEYMSRIVGNSLEVARIETGTIELRPAPFLVSDLMEKIVSMFSAQAKPGVLEFHSCMDSSCVGQLLGDEARIMQILSNMLGNAFKFTSSGSVKLSAQGQAVANGEIVLCFRVEDTGTGIPQDKLASIFDPFVTFGNSVQANASGNGLGLAIARGLAKLMCGDITVKSEPGKGSTFVTTVRVARVS